MKTFKRNILIFLSLLIIFYIIKASLTDDYEFIRNRTDDFYISKGDNVIVKPSIISFDIVDNYVVGLRLPSIHYRCLDGDSYNIKLSNNKGYFILDKITGVVAYFSLKEVFLNEMDKRQIKDKVNLNYGKFSQIWNKYSQSYTNIDYSTCTKQ
ncbi:hypothetical protein [Colwellia sp. MB02u-14]|uniref:hypothetical protein n=1 Tax=Colwellia sp. MB02u-14 TaxID=2759815 RepID=UPI0015F73598|nr:hypothetical protein [Colwellia sp. MB02u-14]MBA6302873.1 hypothetical protein [Colwellia sp. MB02u-14]